ncbi:MAG: translocation/assembly module TamB [Holosporales bacterium]|jgi:autotransporter translocation and assembly factor TamB|nr:translocation/assembly module TamB [Holosporales bacterium]
MSKKKGHRFSNAIFNQFGTSVLMKEVVKYICWVAISLLLLLCGLELTLRSNAGIKYLLKALMYFHNPKSSVEVERGHGSLLKGCVLEKVSIRDDDVTFEAKYVDFAILGLSKYDLSIREVQYSGAILKHERLAASFEDVSVTIDHGNKNIKVSGGEAELTSGRAVKLFGINGLLTGSKCGEASKFEITAQKLSCNEFSANFLKLSGILSAEDRLKCSADFSAESSVFKKLPLGVIKSDLVIEQTQNELKYTANDLLIAGCVFAVDGEYGDHLSGEIALKSISEPFLKVLLAQIKLQWALPILKIFKGSKIKFDNDGEKTEWKFKPSSSNKRVPELHVEVSDAGDQKIIALESKGQDGCFLVNGEFCYNFKDELTGSFSLCCPSELWNIPPFAGNLKFGQSMFSFSLKADDNITSLIIDGTYDDDSINILSLKISSQELEAHNKTHLTFCNKAISGKITGNIKDLGKLAQIGGLSNNISGQASFDIEGQNSSFDVAVHANKISTNAFSAHDIDIHIKDWHDLLPGAIKVSAKYGDVGGVAYKKLSIKTQKSETSDLRYEILCLIGKSNKSILSASGGLSVLDEGIQASIDKFLASSGNRLLRLKDKVFLVFTKDQLKILAPNIIANDNGAACFMLDKRLDGIDIRCNLENFPVSILKIFDIGLYSYGTVFAELICKGKTTNPAVSWKIAVTDLAKRADSHKVRLLCEGSYNSGRLSSLIEVPKLVGTRGRCQINLGCNLTVFPFIFTLIDTAPFEVDCRLESRLSKSIGAILSDEMVCWGGLKSFFKLSGTLQKPIVSGYVTLANAGFEKISSGTYIRNLNLRIESNKSSSLLCQGSANDADVGIATAYGTVRLANRDSIPVLLGDVKVTFQNFKLIDEDDLIVSVDGDSFLKGPIHDLMFSGSLDMPYVFVDIDTNYSDDKSDIQILEAGRHIDVFTQKKIQVRLPFKSNVHLDCKQLKLKGKMLDLSWKGNVRLVGKSNEDSALEGGLKLEKGAFLFLGRTIPIINGTITYSQKAPFVPVVNMYANKDIGIAKVTANIKQQSGEIAFSLKSDPIMPLEAIFSQLLFGKSQHDLTLLEALQVNGVVDVIKKQSNKTFASVQSMDDNAQDLSQYNSPNTGNISLGRYIGNNIYVSAESDTVHKVAYMKVKVSLSPKLSGEANSLGEVGVNWQRRY